MRPVLHGIVKSADIKNLEPEQEEGAIDAAQGPTTMEAENAVGLSYVQTGTIDPALIAKEKAQAVKKNGLLEIVETMESLDSIGG